MKTTGYLMLFIFTVSIFSCKDGTSGSKPGNTERKKGSTEKTAISKIDPGQIAESLQGEWKEPEYPFRRAEFKNYKVKFTEEGVVEEPQFKEFEVLSDCPFETKNIRSNRSNDVFLIIKDDERCEKLNVSNDSLTLSGFNSTINSDYQILYIKRK